MKGLIGRKIGMTQVYDDQGVRVPVTVIEAGPCPVVQVKTLERDGYVAAQLAFGKQKASRLTKAERTRFEKAGLETMRELKEFDLDEGDAPKTGDVVTVDIFKEIKYVNVRGVTKGKGFQGVMHRWGMHGGPMGHGSHTKRRPGSIGARDLPGWVHKGKKMPGDTGAVNRKALNLRVVQVRPEDNLILVVGSVPGPRNGVVYVTKALRK